MSDSVNPGISDLMSIQPYSDAVKIVTQAAVDKVHAFLERLCYPASKELGLDLKDLVKEWRISFARSIVEKGKKKLEARVGDAEVHAHPRMISDIIEKGSRVDDPELQEMWAGLLASSCTEDGKDQSNLVYANILGQMTATQSRILDYICREVQIGYHLPSKSVEAKLLIVPTTKIVEVAQIADLIKIYVELYHMDTLGLITGGFFAASRHQIEVRPTSFAMSLFVRCQGSRQTPYDFFAGRSQGER